MQYCAYIKFAYVGHKHFIVYLVIFQTRIFVTFSLNKHLNMRIETALIYLFYSPVDM